MVLGYILLALPYQPPPALASIPFRPPSHPHTNQIIIHPHTTTQQTAFYQVALASVKEGRKRLLAHKVPYQRPEDFFCDMLKSDEHMAKVRFAWRGCWIDLLSICMG